MSILAKESLIATLSVECGARVEGERQSAFMTLVRSRAGSVVVSAARRALARWRMQATLAAQCDYEWDLEPQGGRFIIHLPSGRTSSKAWGCLGRFRPPGQLPWYRLAISQDSPSKCLLSPHRVCVCVCACVCTVHAALLYATLPTPSHALSPLTPL